MAQLILAEYAGQPVLLVFYQAGVFQSQCIFFHVLTLVIPLCQGLELYQQCIVLSALITTLIEMHLCQPSHFKRFVKVFSLKRQLRTSQRYHSQPQLVFFSHENRLSTFQVLPRFRRLIHLYHRRSDEVVSLALFVSELQFLQVGDHLPAKVDR